MTESVDMPAGAAPARPLGRARIVSRADRADRAARLAAIDEIATLREAAREQGYREGLEAAERDAAERHLTRVIETADWLGMVESRLIEATMRAVERVIGEMDDVVLTRRVARAALREMRGVGAAALHVAPSTADAVRDEIDLILAPFAGPMGGVEIVEVVADSSISPGGAALKSAAGVVDARIETQLAALGASLESAFETRSGVDEYDADSIDESAA
jgi:type III secretion protein L